MSVHIIIVCTDLFLYIYVFHPSDDRGSGLFRPPNINFLHNHCHYHTFIFDGKTIPLTIIQYCTMLYNKNTIHHSNLVLRYWIVWHEYYPSIEHRIEWYDPLFQSCIECYSLKWILAINPTLHWMVFQFHCPSI